MRFSILPLDGLTGRSSYLAAFVVAYLPAVLGCRFAGDPDDPYAGEAPEAAIIDGSVLPGQGGEDALDAPLAAPQSTPATDASTSAKRDAAIGLPVMRGDAGVGASDTCGPSNPVKGCDPVRGSGCPPLMQCDIDLASTEPAGSCVFPQQATGDKCTASFLSESCPAQSTCVGGSCRKTCYCDDDCPKGQCCSDLSGPGAKGAFKLCEPC